ncbi:hypothetical protein [Pelotomaculum schinkii]|nr:hypothetical protein [Pelotomaculum schinkii]
MPAFTEELQEKLNKKEIVFGGCCITGNAPTHHCNKCKKDFGYLTTDMELATTGFNFSLGGYFGGYHSLSIAKAETGAVATYTPPLSVSYMQSIEKQLSTEEWLEFVHGLYRCYIPDWKKHYIDPGILDGTQWGLEITFIDRKPLKCNGSNMFPPHWKKFLKVINKLGLPDIE